MPDYPQFEDLGLIDNDNTEDMRKAPAATEALQNDHQAVTTTTKEI